MDTPLEPDVVEDKWYARGVGEIAERDLRGGSDHQEVLSLTTSGGDDEE